MINSYYKITFHKITFHKIDKKKKKFISIHKDINTQ